ncbi:M14 metallopeptidase family protein [Pseudoalteromonas piscicida]|uniref:Peptidase M14 n=1 Tax=Pseudoalteromonas piscicida TaxID=43662 RepID=A0A2A5JKK8_PSEO7|nr:M14 metallopeptidase family protein [Pseudoalteromonas piscicida]PCK29956.1 peptidase M14 [Pseudoalteromonas piscicida]
MRLISCIILLLSFGLQAKPIDYYFGDEVKFDPTITTPKQAFGYEVGQWHLRHDQIVQYLQTLANESPRLSIETIGYSHEQRPLLLLKASSPQNQQNLASIQQAHLSSLSDDSSRTTQPVVMWMGYSVHGNESSGSNAAVLIAYYLAAAQGEFVTELLENAVVLLDPALNPDGLSRFATWANSNKSLSPSSDPAHREHTESWPSSRTNHYWFDLNRDWLLLQHPESKARIQAFHNWKPNVLTDFHEMGPNSTYFFQPGIPSRTHPITPLKNVELTNEIGKFHAKALDAQGKLYFTQESFDDFYYGKGSTYPDVNGAVGILFEQASSRGHAQETQYGVLSFPETIKNQVTTSLSTFQAGVSHKQALLEYQQQFYQQASTLASKDEINGYVVAKGEDSYRFTAFIDLLKQHHIEVKYLAKDKEVDNRNYQQGDLYIPLAQPQYRLIKALFSTQTHFKDNTFYDVSGWTMPYAYDLDFAALTSDWGLKLSNDNQIDKPPLAPVAGSYAYTVSWHHYLAPQLANRLLQAGVKVAAAMSPFSAVTTAGSQDFQAGTLVIASGIQQQDDWYSQLETIAGELGLSVYSVTTGLTASGVDLGSRQMLQLQKPEVLILGGAGVSQYEVGELWYHLDRHLMLAPSIVEKHHIGRLDLSRYSHILLADGKYNDLSDKAKSKILAWVAKGGVIWGQKRGAQWLIEQQLLDAEMVSSKEMRELFETKNLTFADQDRLSARQRIAGAIFDARLDLSHPLSFGFENSELPVFKNSTWVMHRADKPFVESLAYTKAPLLSGYADAINVQQIAGSSALIASKAGRGVAVGMTDNPVFRGFWYGSSRLLNNALFFAQGIR